MDHPQCTFITNQFSQLMAAAKRREEQTQVTLVAKQKERLLQEQQTREAEYKRDLERKAHMDKLKREQEDRKKKREEEKKKEEKEREEKEQKMLGFAINKEINRIKDVKSGKSTRSSSSTPRSSSSPRRNNTPGSRSKSTSSKHAPDDDDDEPSYADPFLARELARKRRREAYLRDDEEPRPKKRRAPSTTTATSRAPRSSTLQPAKARDRMATAAKTGAAFNQNSKNNRVRVSGPAGKTSAISVNGVDIGAESGGGNSLSARARILQSYNPTEMTALNQKPRDLREIDDIELEQKARKKAQALNQEWKPSEKPKRFRIDEQGLANNGMVDKPGGSSKKPGPPPTMTKTDNGISWLNGGGPSKGSLPSFRKSPKDKSSTSTPPSEPPKKAVRTVGFAGPSKSTSASASGSASSTPRPGTVARNGAAGSNGSYPVSKLRGVGGSPMPSASRLAGDGTKGKGIATTKGKMNATQVGATGAKSSSIGRRRDEEEEESEEEYYSDEDDYDSEEEEDRRYAFNRRAGGSGRGGGASGFADEIYAIFGKKKSDVMARDCDSDEDSSVDMEVGGSDLMREESRAAKLARREDIEEEKRLAAAAAAKKKRLGK